MRNDPHYERWREISWRGKLGPEEEAGLSEWLSAHPEAQADWESEAALNELLTALPNVPVSSNFTARVVAAAERENQKQIRGAGGYVAAPWWRRWVPKAACVAVVLAGLLSYNYIQSVERAERAQSLATMSQLAALPTPEVLNDFDAIAALSATPAADDELLKLMQ